MNWAEVEELSHHGISFGSHSMTHANLTRLGARALDRELRASLDALRARPNRLGARARLSERGPHAGRRGGRECRGL
jgi:peptidoglycan/xylan/chitin deacetylase (PgdA/CDA1 family)